VPKSLKTGSHEPSNQAYWCQYAKDWEAIKMRWELALTGIELSALEEMKESCL